MPSTDRDDEPYYLKISSPNNVDVSSKIASLRRTYLWPKTPEVQEILMNLHEQHIYVLAGNALDIRLSMNTLHSVAAELEKFLRELVFDEGRSEGTAERDRAVFDATLAHYSNLLALWVPPEMLGNEAFSQEISRPPPKASPGTLHIPGSFPHDHVEMIRREFNREAEAKNRVMGGMKREEPRTEVAVVVAEFGRKLEI